MKRLCFGSYVKVLLLCRAAGVIQKKLCGTILLTVAPEYDIRDEDNTVSDLMKCNKNLSPNVTDVIPDADGREVSEKFATTVLKLLDENKRSDIVLALKDIIASDEHIKSDTKVERVNSFTKENIYSMTSFVFADFLAGVFLYVTGVSNTVGKGSIRGIDKNYMETFTNRSDEITFLSEYEPTDSNSSQTSSDTNAPFSKKDIWEASKRDYLSSRSEGNRFASLNILSKLLPNGYVVQDQWEEYAKTEDGEIVPLKNLLDEYATNDISVIGEGGIGKTTYLMKVMEGAFEKDYDNKAAAPIFIELNKCPALVGEWISAKRQKTNFITRYIASQLISCEIENAPDDLLTFIEDEFNKAKANEQGQQQTPDYLILLDGFNEVNRSPALDKHGKFVGSTIRELLSAEIKTLMNCPNIRIIMTSRKMDMVYFSGATKNISLTGVKKDDIVSHLQDNKYRDADINSITASFKLMECLRIPLFLCMFTAGGVTGDDRPTTRGEILYNFFNRTNGLYTERKNAERIHATSNLTKLQTWFILDFVLPHIGWTYEYTDFFAVDKNQLIQTIEDFFTSEDEEVTFWNKKIIAFPDYETDSVSLNDIKDSLASKGNDVLRCIENTLGVMYHDEDFQYYFIHHHVRDYFAGIYEIQRMRMAAKFWDRFYKTKKFQQITDAFHSLSLMNANTWNETKRMFIGEVLGEHKNAPALLNGKWDIPTSSEPLRNLLRVVLNIFRYAEKPVYCGVLNVVETMKDVREILAGVDFSGLNLEDCRLHGINCTVGRGDSILVALFNDDTIISDDTFQISGHFEDVLEFAYSRHAEYLFTMSEENTIKRWEVETGRCMNTIKIEHSQLHEGENLIQYRMVVSNDDESVLTSGFEPNEEGGHFCFVQEYDWKHRRMEYRSLGKFRDINVMNYSLDDKLIVVVYNHNNLCMYRKNEGVPIFSTVLTEVGNVIEARILNETEILLFYTIGSVFVEETPDDQEEVTYRIAKYSIESGITQVLHSYSIDVDWDEYEDDVESIMSPPFCVDSKNKIAVFWESGQMKKLTVATGQLSDMKYKYKEPDFMTFARGSGEVPGMPDLLLLLHYETCVTYNVAGGYEESIYQYEDLNFQLRGKHSAISLLMFDERLNPYEWKLVTDTPVEKYKYSKRSITDVYVKNSTKELVVTFDNDSLVVLDRQGMLVESTYYGKRDAQSCMSLYSNVHDCLIFSYENDNYEYIECHYLATGKTRYAYFDSVEKSKIRSITLSNTEDRFFCEFDKKVTEIDLQTLESTTVFTAGKTEGVQAIYHDAATDIIKIIVTHIPEKESDTQQRPCAHEYKKASSGEYVRIAWYELPHISKFYLQEFSPFYKELYTQPKFAGDSMKLNSEFFLNFGIFLGYDEKIADLMKVEKHIEHGENIGQTETAFLNPHQANHVIGNIPALTAHMLGEGDTPLIQLLYISDDDNAIVAIENKNLIVLKYRPEDDEYEEVCCISPLGEGEHGSPADGAVIYGDDVYFWRHPNLLFSLDITTGEIKQYDSFIPGLAIAGCDFKDAKMSNSVKDMLALHGGQMN